MKVGKILIITSSLVLFFCCLPVFASTNTKERAESNYLVPSYIQITEQNKDNILTTPAIDASEKVYDFADLLTSDEELKLYQHITDFISSTDLDLAIVTINENNKVKAETYARDFYDYNSFGSDSVQSGILFLVDLDTREIYMVTTGRAIDIYNDYRIDAILSDIYTYFSDQNYSKGLIKFVTIVDNYDKLGVPSNNDKRYVIKSDGSLTVKVPWFIFGFCPIIMTIISMVILIYKNKLVRKATSSREYLQKDSVQVKVESDQFLGSNISKIHINTSTGGGSSTGRGSSGIRHGGGGHKF